MKKFYLVIFILFYCGFSYSQNPCPGTPTVTYAGKIYNTVQIGSQCWLKENLDVGTMIDSLANPSNNGIIEKYCYGNNPANCTIYGGFYQWNEAMQYVTTEGTKGICPTGWHIPTKAEYQSLATTVSNNGNALKAVGQGTGSGAGTNISGFSALVAGYRIYFGYFYDLGYYTYFWSSTEYSATGAYDMYQYSNDSGIGFLYNVKVFGFSVRCAKDATTGINDHSNNTLPKSFDLLQNFPNPFNPNTTIQYSIAERSSVTLKVYNMLGREVAELVNGSKEAGNYEVNFDATKLVSGLYVYTLKAGSFSVSKKMLLVK
jgi:uncharacterized protein (TIGR02145 family)